jgi:hypothetical protein
LAKSGGEKQKRWDGSIKERKVEGIGEKHAEGRIVAWDKVGVGKHGLVEKGYGKCREREK